MSSQKKYWVFVNGKPESASEEDCAKIQLEKDEYQLRSEADLVTNAGNNNIRNAAIASQIELDQRESKRQELLLKKTTAWSVAGGAIAAIAGAIMGAILTFFLSG